MKYIIILFAFFMFTNISFAQDAPLEGTVEGIKLEKELEEKIPKSRPMVSRSSLPSTNEPLWVVDGVVVESDFITNELDQNHIAEINVLKGAGATALYGAAGTNGVIIVILKKKYAKKFKKMMKNKKN